MKTRQLTRLGVVRTVEDGCTTIEVGVPCGGCSRSGCLTRRQASQLQIASSRWQPGDEIRLSVTAAGLTSASMTVFGPPLAWLGAWALLESVTTGGAFAASGFGPVLFGCGMVASLILASQLGRRAAGSLQLTQERVGPESGLPASEQS